MPAGSTLVCPTCRNLIPEEAWNSVHDCRWCHNQLEVVVFPAMYSRAAVQAAEAVADGGEASCFYHPENRASVPCDSCGKFLCAVCDLDVDGRHLCHECLDRGIKGDAASLEDRRVLYDSMALHLTTWPVLLIYFSIFTAPIALFLAFRYWRAPMSILPRTRIRWWIAVVLAVLQTGGWAALIFYVIKEMPRKAS